MKQEATKKSRLWLWLVIGAVLLLAAAGTVLALVLGGGSGSGKQDPNGRPDLYWNVDQKLYMQSSESGLSTREAGEDGLYHIRFAYNGEQVELPVSDKRLVNFIDSMSLMGLVIEDGMVVDAKDPRDVATEVAFEYYFQKQMGSDLCLNSSFAMNGMVINLSVGELTEIYNVCADAQTVGEKIEASQLLAMDGITAYANAEGQLTHVYVVSHPTESAIYWRAERKYNTTEKATARIPDENGVYSVDFFSGGERVTLKTKDKALVTSIDAKNAYNCHFGLVFDEEGYFVDIMASANGTRTKMVADRYVVTSVEGNTYTAEELITTTGPSGKTYTGKLAADCKIYDVSTAAKSEHRQGQAVEGLQVGDRIIAWENMDGEAVYVYKSVHRVDSIPYYIPTRKYDSTKKETTREPDANGWYTVELLPAGATVKQTYRTKDKATMSYLDSIGDKCVGLKLEGDEIIYVYDPESLFGRTYLTKGRYITAITGSIVSCIAAGKPENVLNVVLAADCKIYDVSAVGLANGNYGLETTLQVGDQIYASRQPTGEAINVYVTKRIIGTDKLYYNLSRKYDSEKKETTRQPDVEGWYVFELAHQGKIITAKTQSKKIASELDSYSPGAVGLEISGGIIRQVYNPIYTTGGSKVASGYYVTAIHSDGTVETYAKVSGKRTTLKLADGCQIYNTSSNYIDHKGEKTTLKVGDMITAFTNYNGETEVLYVRGRDVELIGWKTEFMYDSDKKETTRTPDAEGWYIYNIAVNGQVKTYKTQDKEIASSLDYYTGAFGFIVKDDVITRVTAPGSVKDVDGLSLNLWDVVSVDGNKLTVKYNLPGSKTTGTVKTVTIAKNAKIYDVSPTAKSFGAEAKLQPGDHIRTYKDDNGNELYLYVMYHDTYANGVDSICSHCGELVHWNPYSGGSIAKAAGHYYLPNDITARNQFSVTHETKDYEVVLDLNGHTVTKASGRFALVSEGESLTVMDSVGGGRICAPGSNGINGGVVMVSSGGRFDLKAGTLELLKTDVKSGYGGVVYMSGSASVFNMDGGTLTGGVVYSKNSEANGCGGNLYVYGGTFNMTAGTITGGQAYGASYEENGKTVTTKGLGGNIYITTGSRVNITGGSIEGGYAGDYGGNIYSYNNNATIHLSGVTVSGGSALLRGGNIHVDSGKWTLDGNTVIKGGTAGTEKKAGYGGNIAMYGGEMTLKAATVEDGTASGGGNLYIYRNSVLNAEAASLIQNGTATSGGSSLWISRYVSGETQLIPTVSLAGSVLDGTTDTADNIRANAGVTVNITGGIIDGNNLMSADVMLNVSGAPVIGKNAEDGLILNTLMNLGQLSDGAEIYVTADGVFTNELENAESYLAYVHSANSNQIIVDGNALSVFDTYGTAENPVIIDSEEAWVYYLNNSNGYAYKHATRHEWHFRVTADIVLDAAEGEDAVNGAVGYSSTGKTTVIDLNGHTVTVNGGTARFMAAANADSDLTMKNGTVELNRETDMNGAVFYIVNGKLTLENVVIREQSETAFTKLGELLYLSGGSAVLTDTTLSGSFANSTATDAVYLNKTSFTVNGGAVDGSVFAKDAATAVTVSGTVKVQSLDVMSGAKVIPGEMVTGALVNVTADGVFTEVLTDAESYVPYFTTTVEGKTVYATAEGCLAVGVPSQEGGDEPQGDGKTPETPILLDSEEEWVYYLNNSTGFAYKHATQNTWYFKVTADIVLDAAEGEDTINGCVGYSSSGKTTVIDLNGFTVTANGGTARFMAAANAQSDLTLKNGTVVMNRATNQKGSLFYVYKGGKLTLENMTIRDIGTAAHSNNGELIYAEGTAATANCTVTLADTVMDGELASANPVYFKMTDVVIQNGSIDAKVTVADTSSTFSISGAAQIEELDLTSGALLTPEQLTTGACIRVTAGDVAFTAALQNAESYLGYIFAADPGKSVSVADGTLVLVACIEGDGTTAQTPVFIDSEEEWVYYLNNSTGYAYKHATQNTWYFKVTADIVLDAAEGEDTVNGCVGYSSSGKTTVIDLNGFTVTAKGGSTRFIAAANESSNLTIKNGTLVVDKTYTSNVGAVFYIKGGALSLENMAVNEIGTAKYGKNGELLYLENGSAALCNTVLTADVTKNTNANTVYVKNSSLRVENTELAVTVNVADTASAVTVAGKTVIERLDLTAGALLTMDQLAEGTHITVAAGTAPFTVENENAADWAGWFHAAEGNQSVQVDGDNCLIIA